MNVEFTSNAKRTFVMTRNGRTVKFDRGKYRTNDREEVKTFLNSPQFKRGDIKVVTPPELLQPFLDGKEPDKLTADVLAGITDEGVIAIVNYLGIQGHGNYPSVAKEMIKGEYIDDRIRKMMKAYPRETPAEDLVEMAKDAGVIYKDGAWNKFRNPDTGNDDTWGKSSAELAKFVDKNRNLVKKAIEYGKEEEA